MYNNLIFLLIPLFFLIIYLFYFRYKFNKLKIEHEILKQRNNDCENLLKQSNLKIKEYEKKIDDLIDEKFYLSNQKEKLQTEIISLTNFYEKSLKDMEERFENISNKILERFSQKSSFSLKEILVPLREDIYKFENKIENISKSEAEKIAYLENELKNLKKLNIKLSTEAENLVKALNGNNKILGNWGEVILEKLLMLSGLEEGRDFKREVNFSTQDGRFRPDVVIYFKNKEIFIDAKTSLKDYKDYISTNDEKFLKKHIASIKTHIDNLSKKNYEKLSKNGVDFVIMFIPIEDALNVVLKNSDLFEYAYKKKIILTSPTTLLVTLKIIEGILRYEKQIENLEDIIKDVEILYDKVRLFYEEFEKVGRSLEYAQNYYNTAKNRLITGNTNVLKQAKKIKEKAGFIPKKEIKV